MKRLRFAGTALLKEEIILTIEDVVQVSQTQLVFECIFKEHQSQFSAALIVVLQSNGMIDMLRIQVFQGGRVSSSRVEYAARSSQIKLLRQVYFLFL